MAASLLYLQYFLQNLLRKSVFTAAKPIKRWKNKPIDLKQRCYLTMDFDALLDEDYKKILEQKTGLQIRKLQGAGMFHAEPSRIMLFDETPAPGELFAMKSRASEVIILDGLSRDDVRDILLALLPDAKWHFHLGQWLCWEDLFFQPMKL